MRGAGRLAAGAVGATAIVVVFGCGGPAASPHPKVATTAAATAPVRPNRCASWPLPSGCVVGLASTSSTLCALTTEDAFCWPTAPWSKERGVTRFGLGELDARGISRTSDRTREGAPFTCAVTAEGDGKRWARCSDGEHWLGVSAKDRLEIGGADAAAVTTGRNHVCVRGADKSVFCIGQNESGQRGVALLDPPRNKPMRVALPPVVDVAASDNTTCALTEAGDVDCWGATSGFPPGAHLPIASRRWTQSAHGSGTRWAPPSSTRCLLGEDGRVVCLTPPSSAWTPIEGLEDIVEITNDMLARRRDGAVFALPSASALPGLAPARALVPGTSCAALADGRVRCQSVHDPKIDDLVELKDARAFGEAAGNASSSSTCALMNDGALRCFGGTGMSWRHDDRGPGHEGPSLWTAQWIITHAYQSQARPLAGIRGVVELSARGSCARTADGRIYALAQVAAGTGREFRLSAVTANGADRAARLIEANLCAAERADGSVFAVVQEGPTKQGPERSPPPRLLELPKLTGAVQLALGGGVLCARFADGSVRCMSSNDLYDALAADFARPIADAPATSFFLFENDVCALLRDGGLVCRDTEHGLAIVHGLDQATPVPVKVHPLE